MAQSGGCKVLFNENGDYQWGNSDRYINFGGSNAWNGKVTLPPGLYRVSFSGSNLFNQPLNLPNTLQDLSEAFAHCNSFNQPITIPDSVTNCANMFQYCYIFNQPITIPDSVTNCASMFQNCSEFNQPLSINGGYTIDGKYSKTIYGILTNCRFFHSQLNINWFFPNSSPTLDFIAYNCERLKNINITFYPTNNRVNTITTTLYSKFSYCPNITDINIFLNKTYGAPTVMISSLRGIGKIASYANISNLRLNFDIDMRNGGKNSGLLYNAEFRNSNSNRLNIYVPSSINRNAFFVTNGTWGYNNCVVGVSFLQFYHSSSYSYNSDYNIYIYNTL